MAERKSLDPGIAFFGNSIDVDMKLKDLQGFLKVVASFLNSMAERLEGQCDEVGLEKSYVFAEPFPSILYSSLITAGVSILESEMRGFASTLKDASGAILGLNDLSGSWLERFRNYCKRVAGRDLKLGKNL